MFVSGRIADTSRKHRRFQGWRLCWVVAAAAVVVLAVTPAIAQSAKINVDENYVAINGYDTVAYFTFGKPTKGDPGIGVRWEDAQWHFANAEHRDMFVRDPDRYAPRFGGFCALGISRGYLSSVDPEAWQIVGGKLFLAADKKSQTAIQGDITGILGMAEKNWPNLKRR